MPDRSARRIIAAGLLAIAAAVAHAAAVVPAAADGDARRPGRFGIRLLEIPENRLDDPRSYAFIVDHVNPGTTFTRRLEVFSTSSRRQHVSLYPAAARVGDAGFTFAPARTANELTSWITLDRSAVDLPPHGRVPVTATVAVPAAAVKGERYAVIWAEISSASPGPAGNVALVNRVGIRTYLDVGPGGEPPTRFRIGEVTAGRTEDGQPRLVAEVGNTGERAVDLEGEVRLSDGPSALSAGPFRGTRIATLPPGGHGQVAVPLGRDLPAGPWRFRLTLRSGLVTRTATGTITFPTAGERAARTDPSVPVLVAVAVAGLAAMVLLVVNLRRFRRRPLDGEAA
ncbi:peptidase [Microbispora sp. H11081]|uniref:peptidase n=1 Tax=Microbispora sp. H11081 TaxID=2729107 RepID=UPI001474ED03|nr:peptidase [Microbispora sp. H11081]